MIRNEIRCLGVDLFCSRLTGSGRIPIETSYCDGYDAVMGVDEVAMGCFGATMSYMLLTRPYASYYRDFSLLAKLLLSCN